MASRILCKLCKDIIQSKGGHDLIYCKCGSLGVDGGSSLLRVLHNGNRDSYCLVDDQDNEITVKDELEAEKMPREDAEAPIMSDKELTAEIMLSLRHHIQAGESWSSAHKFSPCVNQDLLALQEWLDTLLRVLIRRLALLEMRHQDAMEFQALSRNRIDSQEMVIKMILEKIEKL